MAICEKIYFNNMIIFKILTKKQHFCCFLLFFIFRLCVSCVECDLYVWIVYLARIDIFAFDDWIVFESLGRQCFLHKARQFNSFVFKICMDLHHRDKQGLQIFLWSKDVREEETVHI